MVVTATLAGTVACSKCSSTTGGGYGVVDPMPPPARCYGLGVIATATWVTTDAGARAIALEISNPTAMGATFTPDPISVLSGTLVSTELSPTGRKVIVVPEPGRGSIIATLDVTCSSGPGALHVAASWGSTADGGLELTTSITEL
jgi:hypothetical protein